MYPFPSMFMGLAAKIVSALKFTAASSNWSLSADGLTATRGAGTSPTTAKTAFARTTGPAAVSYLCGGMSNAPSATVVALYPPDAAVTDTPTTNRFAWRADGSVNINGADTQSATAAYSYTSGDLLTIRLNAAGTSSTLVKNGTVLGSFSITALSRVPAVSAVQPGGIFTINGAPDGETPWS